VSAGPTVREVAQFRTDIPYDGIEEDDEFVQYPGKGVTEAVAEILRRLGCEVEGPISADFKGWELAVSAQGRQLRCRVGYIEDVILSFWDPSWINELLHRHHPVYLDTLTRFAEALRADSRFHDVRWCKGEHVGLPVTGAADPVSK
jgi:hypothetical protein